MKNIELQRDNRGALNLVVGNQFAVGAKVTGVNMIDGELYAIVVIPLKELTLGEVTNVVPFARRSEDG